MCVSTKNPLSLRCLSETSTGIKEALAARNTAFQVTVDRQNEPWTAKTCKESTPPQIRPKRLKHQPHMTRLISLI